MTYRQIGEESCIEFLVQQFNIPVYVRPDVRKMNSFEYEFTFNWYSIMTDGDDA